MRPTRMVETQKVIFTFFETEAIQKDLKNKNVLNSIITINKVSATFCVSIMQEDYSMRNTFSIFLPFASSSTSLSKYRTFCVRGFVMSSILYQQIVPVMS